jgi:hypothetical protein
VCVCVCVCVSTYILDALSSAAGHDGGVLALLQVVGLAHHLCVCVFVFACCFLFCFIYTFLFSSVNSFI